MCAGEEGWKQISRKITWSAIALAGVAFCFAFFFLSFAPLAQRPFLVFAFAFVIDLGLLAPITVLGTLSRSH